MTDSRELVSSVVHGNKETLARTTICKICDMDAAPRRTIEELMARGVSNTVIIQIASSMFNEDLSGLIITKHIDHLPAKYYVYKEIIERRAREMNVDLDDNSNRITPIAYMEIMMQDSLEHVVKNPGSTNQYIGMAAAKTLMEVDSANKNDESIAEWVSKYKQILSAIKLVCSEDQINAIYKAIQ